MSSLRRKWKIAGLSLLATVAIGLAGAWIAGGLLTATHPRAAGLLPEDLPGETIEFPSSSGAKLRGWFIPGKQNADTIIVMHGVRGARTDMLGRSRFLHQAGYAVLLFDFQAHGESTGKQITFGFLESKDAQAAVDFVRRKNPGGKIAAIGVSLGGAAILLAKPSLPVDAMILEMVYPTIEQATKDRFAIVLGSFGKLFSPLLTCQLRLRLGVSVDDLRPIDCVAKISAPKLFIAGMEDHHTTIAEAKELFATAASPKQFWAVARAAHIDLHGYAKREYEERVLKFLNMYPR
jgi:fermentation-respiration switch protein FrsA (DUF1100 family)